MIEFIFTFFGSAKYLPDKDPEDLSLTDNSTKWTSYEACPNCLSYVSVSEQIKKVCPHCGHVAQWMGWARVRRYRKIVKDGKWIYQYRN